CVGGGDCSGGVCLAEDDYGYYYPSEGFDYW
nr:immunoglobulin heavy chain junction region [Macaca mulatta]MOX15259.1 immunoglobulin heavy chain junction region [Macaca mulatta]MOX15330.1 immunoglobulin heavy chain junction region [Macaca mulatta]MOX15332.1 immunoglobulin heavy chain junction region [Macaca mulatta]MOX15827.1 immunoglobulin heavy chain junction region [Macaca mulatta]